MQVGGNNFYSIKIDFQLESALNQFFISQTNVQIIYFCLLVFCVILLPILEQFGNIQTNSYAEKNFKTQGLVQKLNPLNREGVYQVTPNVTRGLGFFRFIRRSTPNQLPFSINQRTYSTSDPPARKEHCELHIHNLQKNSKQQNNFNQRAI